MAQQFLQPQRSIDVHRPARAVCGQHGRQRRRMQVKNLHFAVGGQPRQAKSSSAANGTAALAGIPLEISPFSTRDQANPQHPRAASNLHRLAKYRREFGGQFVGLLNNTSGDPDVVETIAPPLEQLDRSDITVRLNE